MVIRLRGTSGINSHGVLGACLEYPFIDVYGYKKYPSLFIQAAALLYAITVFHPFVDGNKRTALAATSIFLYPNGYNLQIPAASESVGYMLAIAKGEIEDVNLIAKWLKSNSALNQWHGVKWSERPKDLGNLKIQFKE